MRGKAFVGVMIVILMVTASLCAIPGTLTPSQQDKYSSTPAGNLGRMPDRDQDGLLDVEEADLGTNPDLPDTDGDGWSDAAEYAYWTNLSNTCSTQPVPAWVRARHPGESTSHLSTEWGPRGDLDGDGLANIVDPDSDADGITDGQEANRTLNPANPDTDMDGVIDGFDPRPAVNSDTDRDGMADDWETVNSVADPNADTDMDGVTNAQEFQSGTDPNNQFRPSTTSRQFSVSELYLRGYEGFYGAGSITEALFQVTPITNPRYWRVQSFETFDTVKWTDSSQSFFSYNGTLPGGVDDVTGSMINNGETYRVTINGTLGGQLVTSAHTKAVSFTSPSSTPQEVNNRGEFKTTRNVAAYNFTAVFARYGPELASATPDLSGPLSVPAKYTGSNRVLSLALEMTRGFNTTVQKLEAIALWLRDNCRFNRYASQSTGSEDALDHFLFDSKGGISVDFATAFAMLSRMNGIPARIVIGFAPGIIKGDCRYVQLGHKHAWAEVNLKGLGWVGVECTPENAQLNQGIGLGSSGIDINVLQFWDNGVESWWYYNTSEGRPSNLGATGGGTVRGGFLMPANPIPNATANDSDGDGMNNTEEAVIGTNPYSSDTDLDGISDRDEVRVHRSNPRMNDADGDGLSDQDEINKYHTNPNKSDTDGGGTCDHQEVDGGTNPLDPADDHSWRDFDNDHVRDDVEISQGTDPRGTDKDYDGLTDVYEAEKGTNPALSDSDGDGLHDNYELQMGTNPAAADSDGDGLNDDVELRENLNPNSADTDGDGLDDRTELYDHTLNPRVYDQDRDGVSDSVEREHNLDPQNSDTNNDGTDDFQTITTPDDPTGPTTPSEGSPWLLIVAVLLMVMMVAAYGMWRRKHVDEIEKTLRKAEKRLTEIVVDKEPDEIRRVIYRTYRELCTTLRHYEFLKRDSWTLREFGSAVEDALSIDSRSLKLFLLLVEEARYSNHRLTPDYKDRALTCVRGILGSLQSKNAGAVKPKARAAA